MIHTTASRLRLVLMFILSCAAFPVLAITGLWSGELRDASGQREAVSYRFSAAGNLMLVLQTRQGDEEVEIHSVGQQRQWLLPGSGWGRGTVEALSVRSDRVQAVIEIYTESGGGELLDQRQQRLVFDFSQSGRSLHATVLVVDLSHGSAVNYGLHTRSTRRTQYRGVLHREG